jgi:prepilin-type N-terminal cleavage/methylation domain-containing protein
MNKRPQKNHGFSLIEIVICLLLLSMGVFGYLSVNRQSLQLLQKAQVNFKRHTQQLVCHELFTQTNQRECLGE